MATRWRQSPRAVRATADQIEAMVFELEALFAGDGLEICIETFFQLGREPGIGDLAAVGADEVVMMLGERLGQLVVGEVVIGDDAMHDPGLFQHGQVAVDGALGQVGPALHHVGDAQRLAGHT